jgi:hypothetical protein
MVYGKQTKKEQAPEEQFLRFLTQLLEAFNPTAFEGSAGA